MVCTALETGLMILKLTLGPPAQKLWALLDLVSFSSTSHC